MPHGLSKHSRLRIQIKKKIFLKIWTLRRDERSRNEAMWIVHQNFTKADIKVFGPCLYLLANFNVFQISALPALPLSALEDPKNFLNKLETWLKTWRSVRTVNARRINRKTLGCGCPYWKILASFRWTYQVNIFFLICLEIGSLHRLSIDLSLLSREPLLLLKNEKVFWRRYTFDFTVKK